MIAEIVTFKLRAGYSPEDVVSAARPMTLKLREYDGFIRRDLLRDPETDRWTDVLYWTSREAHGAAAETAPQEAAMAPFMQMIDESDATMDYLEHYDVS